jgi:hypothetical protein
MYLGSQEKKSASKSRWPNRDYSSTWQRAPLLAAVRSARSQSTPSENICPSDRGCPRRGCFHFLGENCTKKHRLVHFPTLSTKQTNLLTEHGQKSADARRKSADEWRKKDATTVDATANTYVRPRYQTLIELKVAVLLLKQQLIIRQEGCHESLTTFDN